MNDVSFFWIAFASYLVGMSLLLMAALKRGGESLARLGRAVVWVGLASQTVSIVWRSFVIGSVSPEAFLWRMGKAFSSGPAWQAAVYGLMFLVAAAAVVLALAFRRRRMVWLPAAAVAVILELILLDFLDFTRLPIANVYEYLSIASWCSALALLALSATVGLVVIDAALAIAACVLTVFAATQPKTVELQLVPALQSYWLFIHVSLASVAYAIFCVASVVAGLLLIKTYDRSLVQPGTRLRFVLASGTAKALAAAAVLAMVLSGLLLPFREVAYAPHELAHAKHVAADSTADAEKTAGDGLPPVGTVQVVRYGAALLGVFGTMAVVFMCLLYPFFRLKGDKSGFGLFVFAAGSGALFVACLVLGGIVRTQEHAISVVSDEKAAVERMTRDLLPENGALTRDALVADVERWRSLAHQARNILGSARWLPFTLEKQDALAQDPLFLSLQDLYRRCGAEWKPVIRHKDIKQLGRELGERAALTEAAARRLSFPADRDQLLSVEKALGRECESREANALLPRQTTGQVAAFVGLSFLLAVPIGLALYFLLPLLMDRIPDAARLDRISYGAVLLAYPLFTFGALFAGAIWAHFAWGAWWSWDPKEVGSLVGWVLYTVYLHQRYREGLNPRMAAAAAILGFLALTLSLAGNAFLGGLHAYA